VAMNHLKNLFVAFAVLLCAGAARAQSPILDGLRSEAGKESLINAPAASAGAAGACGTCGMDSGVYKRVLYYTCRNGSTYITDSGAQDVARWAREGTIDVDVFLSTFYSTCRYEEAAEVGRGSRKGSLSASVYRRVLYYTCRNGSTYLTHEGAVTAASRAAEGTIDVDVFMSVFYATCNSDSAFAVACK
jgi:hypothetical protein